MTLSCSNLVCLVKPRRTRKEELQEAARQRVAAALAQSNTRNRVYGGQATEGRKAGGPRRSKGTINSKPTPVKGIEHEGGKTTVKPASSAASNLQDGKYHDWFMILSFEIFPPSSPPASLSLSFPPPYLSPPPSLSYFHPFVLFFLSSFFFYPSFIPSILPFCLPVCLPFFPSFLQTSLSLYSFFPFFYLSSSSNFLCLFLLFCFVTFIMKVFKLSFL